MIPHSKPWISQGDIDAVEKNLHSCMVSSGVLNSDFEKLISEYLNGFTCTVQNGASGILLALEAFGVGFGDEVVLPSYVCSNVLDAVEASGAQAVLCDVSDSWLMTPGLVEEVITEKTKAIICVHTFGIRLNLDDFKRFGVCLIEDSCQAFGAIYDDNQDSVITVCSFGGTKCLTTGEGGALVTKSEVLFERIKSIKNRKYFLYSSISDLQAALGISQISRYDEILIRRREIMLAYNAVFKRAGISVNQNADFLFRYTFIYPFQNAECFFSGHGVVVRKGVDSLLHRRMNLPDRNYKNSAFLIDNTVSVPFYPAMTDADVSQVCSVLEKLYDRS